MKNITVIAGILIILLSLLAGLVSCSSKINASPGEQFTLPQGKTASIDGENLSIKFAEVTADSRCPKGVECIWAGEARCRILITYNGSESEVTLTQPGSSVGQESFMQYTFSFTLEPYPEANKQIAESDYKLIMTVTK